MSDDTDKVLRVREGHGANCSSVGSVVDTVFLGAMVGGVVLAMVAAAMRKENITIVGDAKPDPKPTPDERSDDAP